MTITNTNWLFLSMFPLRSGRTNVLENVFSMPFVLPLWDQDIQLRWDWDVLTLELCVQFIPGSLPPSAEEGCGVLMFLLGCGDC